MTLGDEMSGIINEVGIEEIKKFLEENHKKGNFDRDMLLAWARDAEFQLSEGNSPTIEIRSMDSVSGKPVTYTVSPAGVDEEEEGMGE